MRAEKTLKVVMDETAYLAASDNVADNALWQWLAFCDQLIAWRVVTWADAQFVLYMADEHERFILWSDALGEEMRALSCGRS